MNFVRDLLIGLMSLLFFYVAWPPNGYTCFIFVAFVPLLWLLFASSTQTNIFSLFLKLLILFFVINFSLTSWVMNAHWGGGLFASVFNAFLMSGVMILVFKIRKILGDKHGFIAFPTLWLAFEYLHLNWELTWPWLTLGNVFSDAINWIQWYEYTGTLGGSLWVLLLNMYVFLMLKTYNEKGIWIKPYKILVLAVLPIAISHLLYHQNSNLTGDKLGVLIVQPNYEPHDEKFKVPQSQQLDRVKSIIFDFDQQEVINLILLPETFVVDWIWESRVETAPALRRMKEWLRFFPEAEILTGASTGKIIKNPNIQNPSIRKSSDGQYFEVYNTALLLSTDRKTQIFHKSKLVPGAEMTPFASFLRPLLEAFPIKIGGTIGNFGVNDSIVNLGTSHGNTASMICYESIFPDYVRSFVLAGADWISIITNDGWWGETFGYQQHNAYARLRAIENRRYITRSANTGVSSFINHLGEEVKRIPYNQQGAMLVNVFKLNKITFYTQYGDYLGRIASLLSIVYILHLLLSTFMMKQNKT